MNKKMEVCIARKNWKSHKIFVKKKRFRTGGRPTTTTSFTLLKCIRVEGAILSFYEGGT